MNNTKKIKYVHIMSHESKIFNKQVIDMINSNKHLFEPEEHIFIIQNEEVYNQIEKSENVIWEYDISSNIKKIKRYANICDYIFLHSNTLSTFTLLFLNNKILNKIIWCVWGHDLYQKSEKPHTLYRKVRRLIGNTIRFIPKHLRNMKIKQFYAAGIGFQYDVIEIKRIYGDNMNVVMTPYGYKENNKEKMDEIISNMKKKDYCKVMVGHSAYKFLNHISLLEDLAKYKSEKIFISLVLAYGDKEYAETVKNKAIEIFGKEKVEIIDTMMNYEQYVKYLSTVDVCLLDYKHQAALSNIYMLLYMKKKIFLNKEGIIKLFTILENIETYNIDDIHNMNFEEFSKEIDNYQNGKQFAEFHINEENYKNLWYNTLKSLK